MKAKAKSLTTADPHQKVDSSTWSPAEPLNADIKTGMRPLSRRAFKAGGKVQGAKAKANLGKGTRGSNKPITPDTMANKDVKAANMDRPGIKHVGGMKKGGVACKEEGGVISSAMKRIRNWATNVPEGYGQKPTESKPAPTTSDVSEADKAKLRGIIERDGQKKGGRAKKADGGELEAYGKGVSGAAEMMKKAGQRAGVPGGLYGAGFSRVGAGKLSPMGAAVPMSRMKKGGEAKHPDEKMDIALIKKMVKPSARKGKDGGGGIYNRVEANRAKSYPTESMEETISKMQPVKAAAERNLGMRPDEVPDNYKKGGRTARATGGEVFSGPSYPGKIPGVVPGGREARATGGKTKGKGKTNINIVIAAGKPAGQADMMPPGGPTPPPGGLPVPVPPPQAGGMPGGGAPMPMPIPMPMPAAGGTPGGMPTPRKDGGRLTKVAKSYKDMEAGAGGGEGRLQKTDIAKKHKDAPAFRRGGRTGRDLGGPATGLHGTRQKSGEDFMPVDEALWLEGEKKSWSDPSYNKGQGPTKAAANRGELLKRKAGGRTYRSYKDMDAGAGSGMGRLEKTEIQARKG
jgi:hypothetical protein